MADLVNEIIAPEALAQLKQAREELKGAASDVTELAKLGKGITFNFKGIDNIKDLTAAVKTAEDAQDRIAKGNEKYIASVNKKNTAEEKAFQAMLARDNAERARGQKALDDQIKRQEKLQQATERTTKQREKELERERKATEKLNNAYEQLKVEYAKAANEAKKLGAQFGINDSRAKAAAASALKMSKSLLAVEMSVGQAQRQVGQYNTAAFAMSQILRETPAFAYSAATGFLAISNNIPILVDEIEKLKVANAALKAEGAATIPIWKTLASSIFSVNGMITIAVGVFTIVAAKWNAISAAIGGATSKYQEFIDVEKKSIYSEKATIETALSVAKDFNQEMGTRLAAIKKLKDEYPEYLGNLTDEMFLSGTTADAMERLNKALVNKALMMAATKQISEQADEYIKLNNELEKYQEKSAKAAAQFKQYNNGSTNQFAINARVRAAQDQANADREVRSIQKQIKKVEAEMNKYQNLANKFAGGAAGLLFPSSKDKDKNAASSKKETEFKGNAELIKATYEQNRMLVEQDRDAQKQIADNVEKSLQERLDANMKYQADLLQLADMERGMAIDLENEKINQLEAQKKTANAIELKNIDIAQRAAIKRLTTAQLAYQNEVNNIKSEGEKAALNIVKTSNEEWIKSEREALEAKMQLEIASYLVEEQLLEDALSKKQITRKQYNKRLSDLQRKEKISFLLAEIEYDKKILENQTLTDKQRLDATKKLNNDQEALFKARKGVGSTKVSGRITDSIARLFNPDAEEQYLQEFYNKTVELANNAANAIIDAQNRQYENERRQLDEQSAQIRINAKQKEDVINATVRNDIERQNQLSKLAAQTAAQENEIEAKKREVARRQAEFQKKASIAAIIQNTAVAIAGALKYGVAAPPIIALIAASGAVQLAAASNTAIPAYKDGTLNHTGGAFFAGDGGERERIITPYGKSYWSNSTTTQYNEPKGTMVIPESVLKFAPPVTNNHTDIQRMYEFKTASDNKKLLQMVTSVVAEEFHSVGKGLAGAIYDTAPKDIDIRQLATEMRRAQTHQGK